MKPLRDVGCQEQALLFRREDPPVTPEVIRGAWSRLQLCGNFCRCHENAVDSLDGAEGTNWVLLDKPQTGYDKIVTAN